MSKYILVPSNSHQYLSSVHCRVVPGRFGNLSGLVGCRIDFKNIGRVSGGIYHPTENTGVQCAEMALLLIPNNTEKCLQNWKRERGERKVVQVANALVGMSENSRVLLKC